MNRPRHHQDRRPCEKRPWPRALAIALTVVGCQLAVSARAQTVANPILIEAAATDATLAAGQESALTITFRIPNGFWLGEDHPAARIPAGTIIHPVEQDGFSFGKPLFPEPEVRGVPVHQGTTRVFVGEIKAVLPFRVGAGTAPGEYTLTVEVTYTPGLNAGHLTSHVHEPYSAAVTVIDGRDAIDPSTIPEPTKGPVPADFLVEPRGQHLPQPLKAMFHHWDESSGISKFFHKVFLDEGDAGKHIRTVWHPATESSKNGGDSLGLGVSMMDVTREGIMTGMFDVSVFDNEYVGTTATFDVISCPCAYFNYHLSGEIGSDRDRQLHLHVENMTLGRNRRHGIEFQIDAFQDPRYRFYGLGGRSQEASRSNYAHEEFGGFVDVYWQPVDHFRFSVGGKVRSVDIKRGANQLIGVMPATINVAEFADVPGIHGAIVAGGRINLVYDGRNQEFTPSSGLFAKLTTELDHVSADPTSVSEYGRFHLDLRQYLSTVDQRYTLVLRNAWTFTTDENIPFFEKATLGGPDTLRGFDFGRFYGQNSVFASVELRAQLLHMYILGSPMDVEMSPFLDVGQVFDSTDFEGEMNFNPGISLRMLNRPNIGFIINAASGQDGLLVSGGLSLPF